MGRWSIFRDQAHGKNTRVQGYITTQGGTDFEQARKALGSMYRLLMGRDAIAVSDADTIEFLARGLLETRRYLQQLKRSERREATLK